MHALPRRLESTYLDILLVDGFGHLPIGVSAVLFGLRFLNGPFLLIMLLHTLFLSLLGIRG